MSTLLLEAAMRQLGDGRHHPVASRIRATLGGRPVVDTTRAVLVWEPGRIGPSCAVPAEDLRAHLQPAPPAPDGPLPPILHPGIPFAVHTAEGDALTVRAHGETREGAAFRLADPDLAGLVLLDFGAFDAWWEEDERLVAHPRDPQHHVDVRRSSRHVRIVLDGSVVAESTRPRLVLETLMPVRFYLPREDVLVPMRPSALRTACAYKGEASYWSVEAGGRVHEHVAWSYEDPLPDSGALTGLVAFYDELVDVELDGGQRDRPSGVVADALREEFGLGD
jgi:uncharacterized protein (DUF427 family)